MHTLKTKNPSNEMFSPKNDWKFFSKLLAVLLLWAFASFLVVNGLLWTISLGIRSECDQVNFGIFGPAGVVTIAWLMLKFGSPFSESD